MKMLPSEGGPGFLLLYNLCKISPDEPYTYEWHTPKLQDDPYIDLKVEIKLELTPQMVLLKFNDGDASQVMDCFTDFPFKDPITSTDSILIKTLPIEEFFHIHIRYCNQEGGGASDYFPYDDIGQMIHDLEKPSKEQILDYFKRWNNGGWIFQVFFVEAV